MKRLKQKRDEITYPRPHFSLISVSVLSSTIPVVLLMKIFIIPFSSYSFSILLPFINIILMIESFIYHYLIFL